MNQFSIPLTVLILIFFPHLCVYSAEEMKLQKGASDIQLVHEDPVLVSVRSGENDYAKFKFPVRLNAPKDAFVKIRVSIAGVGVQVNGRSVSRDVVSGGMAWAAEEFVLLHGGKKRADDTNIGTCIALLPRRELDVLLDEPHKGQRVIGFVITEISLIFLGETDVKRCRIKVPVIFER